MDSVWSVTGFVPKMAFAGESCKLSIRHSNCEEWWSCVSRAFYHPAFFFFNQLRQKCLAIEVKAWLGFSFNHPTENKGKWNNNNNKTDLNSFFLKKKKKNPHTTFFCFSSLLNLCLRLLSQGWAASLLTWSNKSILTRGSLGKLLCGLV